MRFDNLKELAFFQFYRARYPLLLKPGSHFAFNSIFRRGFILLFTVIRGIFHYNNAISRNISKCNTEIICILN